MTYLTIRVRVTKEQYDLIKSKAGVLGFSTVSAYIRDVALKDLHYVRLLREIHRKVCG